MYVGELQRFLGLSFLDGCLGRVGVDRSCGTLYCAWDIYYFMASSAKMMLSRLISVGSST